MTKSLHSLLIRISGLIVLSVVLMVQTGFAQPRTSVGNPFPGISSDHSVSLPDVVRLFRFSSDSKRLQLLDYQDQPFTWDLVERRLNPSGPGPVVLDNSISGASLASDSERGVLRADDQGTIRLENPKSTETLKCFRGHSGLVAGSVVSSDGRLLISGGRDCTLRLWNIEKETEICQIRVHGKRLDELDDELRMQDALAKRGGVHRIALSPNDQFLVTAGLDRMVCIRELRTLEVLDEFSLANWWVWFTWSPSSEYLVLKVSDGGLIIHNVYAHLKQNAPVPRVLKRIGGYQDFWSRSSPNPTNEIVPANAVDVEWEDSWDALTGNAPLAYRTMERMIDAPAKATSFLRSKIEIPSVVSKETLRQWFVDLNDNSYRVRVRAMRELAQSASANPTVLRAELSSELTVEARNRIEELLRQRERFIPTPERLRLFRVIYLLERINTPESQAMLRQFAALPKDDEFAQAANRALKRCDFAK